MTEKKPFMTPAQRKMTFSALMITFTFGITIAGGLADLKLAILICMGLSAACLVYLISVLAAVKGLAEEVREWLSRREG